MTDPTTSWFPAVELWVKWRQADWTGIPGLILDKVNAIAGRLLVREALERLP